MNGDDSPYEYVPVANPIIPTNKLLDCDETKIIDSLMIERGFKILDPTLGQSSMVDDNNSSEYKDNLEGKFFDRFSLKLHSKAAYSDNAVIVAMNFNPFNPRSAKMIEQFEWESEHKAVGTYKYRNKIYRFDYDLNSKLFRYHSDIWMKKLGLDIKVQYHYQSFDLVCVKRFLEGNHVPRNYGLGKNFNTVLIEPIWTKRVPVLDYSIIGPWEGEIGRGIQNDKFYSPYLTPKMKLQELETESRFRSIIDHRVYFDEVHDMENNVRMKYYKGKVYDDRYFFRKTGKDSVLLVRDDFGNRRMYECNFRMVSHFSNFKSSIIDHPITTTVVDYILECNKNLKDQKMQAHEWATTVDENYTKLQMQSVVDLKDPEILEVDRSYKRLVGIDIRTNVQMVGLKKIKPRIRKVVEKDNAEKMVAAIRSHDYGPEYKKIKFYKDYYSAPRKTQLSNDLIMGKCYLNSQNFPLPLDNVGEVMAKQIN